MEALTRLEWEQLWARIDPDTVGKTMSLSQYSELVNQEKARWHREIPAMKNGRTDNARYVVHLEDALKRGLTVTPEMLATVDPQEDLRYDRFAFPLLNAALEKAKGRASTAAINYNRLQRVKSVPRKERKLSGLSTLR